MNGKNSIASLIICFSLIILLHPIQGQSNKNLGDLTIIISGLKNDKGEIQIGLFNSEESWEDKKEKFHGAKIKIKNNRAEWVIKNIPYGEYAIKFFHDENMDDKINTNFFGIPSEIYGFYLCGISKYIPPSFNKAKFIFKSKTITIEIKTNL